MPERVELRTGLGVERDLGLGEWVFNGLHPRRRMLDPTTSSLITRGALLMSFCSKLTRPSSPGFTASSGRLRRFLAMLSAGTSEGLGVYFKVTRSPVRTSSCTALNTTSSVRWFNAPSAGSFQRPQAEWCGSPGRRGKSSKAGMGWARRVDMTEMRTVPKSRR